MRVITCVGWLLQIIPESAVIKCCERFCLRSIFFASDFETIFTIIIIFLRITSPIVLSVTFRCHVVMQRALEMCFFLLFWQFLTLSLLWQPYWLQYSIRFVRFFNYTCKTLTADCVIFTIKLGVVFVYYFYLILILIFIPFESLTKKMKVLFIALFLVICLGLKQCKWMATFLFHKSIAA